MVLSPAPFETLRNIHIFVFSVICQIGCTILGWALTFSTLKKHKCFHHLKDLAQIDTKECTCKPLHALPIIKEIKRLVSTNIVVYNYTLLDISAY